MTVDDLQDLYSELRGSRSAPAIMDARAHFLERQWGDALSKLTEAYEKYCETRQRILRQDPEKQVDAKAKDRDRQIRRLMRKQDKAREIIGKLETYLPQLEKLAEKEKAKEHAKQIAAEEDSSASDVPADSVPADASVSDAEAINKESIDPQFLQHFSELIGDRQLDLVSSQFDFRPLDDPDDVAADAVYLLRKGDRCLLVHADVSADDAKKLKCVDIDNAKNRVELSRNAMVRLSQKRKLVLLIRKR